jgi:hypothetical protein
MSLLFVDVNNVVDAAKEIEVSHSNQILLYESLMLEAAKVLYIEGYTTLCDQLLGAIEQYKGICTNETN